jgi:hypothetical protein
LDKGEKLIYLKSSPSLEFGTGYYLFPLEDPIYDHLLTLRKDLVDKIIDHSTFVEMHKNNLLPPGSIVYVSDSNIRPFSEDIEKRITKRLTFVKTRYDKYKTYFQRIY